MGNRGPTGHGPVKVLGFLGNFSRPPTSHNDLMAWGTPSGVINRVSCHSWINHEVKRRQHHVSINEDPQWAEEVKLYCFPWHCGFWLILVDWMSIHASLCPWVSLLRPIQIDRMTVHKTPPQTRSMFQFIHLWPNNIHPIAFQNVCPNNDCRPKHERRNGVNQTTTVSVRSPSSLRAKIWGAIGGGRNEKEV